jgi:hypothetical protein
LANTWDRFCKTPLRTKTFRINFHPQIFDKYPPQKTTYLYGHYGQSLSPRHFKAEIDHNYNLLIHLYYHKKGIPCNIFHPVNE